MHDRQHRQLVVEAIHPSLGLRCDGIPSVNCVDMQWMLGSSFFDGEESNGRSPLSDLALSTTMLRAARVLARPMSSYAIPQVCVVCLCVCVCVCVSVCLGRVE